MMLAALLVGFSVAVAPAEPPHSFLSDRPWLAEKSAWSESVRPGQDPRGWWCVGNSRAFGIVGPELGNATISQITGPHIMLANVMNNGSAFGPARLNLTIGGPAPVWDKIALSKVRRTGIDVMDFTSRAVRMTVLNYAPFRLNALLRTVVVQNLTSEPLSGVKLVGSIGRTTVQDGMLFDSFQGSKDGAAMGQTRRLFSGFIEPCEASAGADKVGSLTVDLGDVAPHGEAVRTQFLAFDMKEVGDHGATIAAIRKLGTALLSKSYDQWRAWMARTTTLECPDRRIADLLDDTKALIKMQTAEPQGAAGPMEFFAGVWIRDSNGPMKYYLRMGDLGAAKKMLEFYYSGATQNRAVPNFLPMDVDVRKPIDSAYDWSKVRTDHAETPCWQILQHVWYYRASGDLGLIRKHWGYLKRCLTGQIVDEAGRPFRTVNYAYTEPRPNALYRFPHHGDETWIYPGFEVLNSDVFPEPNDHVHWDEYSADSTWEFVRCAEALADFATRLKKPAEAAQFARIAKNARAALERDYWMPEKGFYAPAMGMEASDRHQPPFTMVNLNPLWIGYLQPDDPKAVSNLLETLRYTLNPNGLTDATETLRVYVGMQPGMLLYNLAAVGHPLAARALKALVSVASPSGEYTEKQVTDRRGYATAFMGHHIRPWEGGVNCDAAFYYLTGLAPDMGSGRISLCPQLPFSWRKMAVKGEHVGDGILSVKVTDDGRKRSYLLSWTGKRALTCAFRVSIPGARIGSVSVGGRRVSTRNGVLWNVAHADLDFLLRPGPASVVATYGRVMAQMPQIKRMRYSYVVPRNEPFHDIVLWGQEPRRTSPTDVRTIDILRKGLRARLVLPFVPSDAEWLRPILMKPDGQINASVFLLGPNSITQSLKYAKWWSDPRLSKLLRAYMTAGGIVAMVKAGETTSEYFGDLLKPARYLVIPAPASPAVPAPGPADVLGLGKYKAQAAGAFVLSGVAPLARLGSDAGSPCALAVPIGKGLFIDSLVDMSYESLAAFAARLADPAFRSSLLKQVMDSEGPDSGGAFDDQGRDGAYADDFHHYPEGSVGLPAWLPLAGTWKVSGGEYHMTNTNGYDFISTLNAAESGDYRIEATARLVEGIFEPGFVFNSPSRFTTSRCQMVRFSGFGEVWCGPVVGGFSLENTLPTGLPAQGSGAHTIGVSVHNGKGTFDVDVDGKTIGKDLKLGVVAAPGAPVYVGLMGCRGHLAFSSFLIRRL